MAGMVVSERHFQFGTYEADTTTGELRKNGSRLKVQGQPFQVLVLLLEAQGRLVTREELRTKLWSQDTFVDFDHSLNTAINKLREALNDSPSSPRYIETLARRGYRFIAPVIEIGSGETRDKAAATAAPTPDVRADTSSSLFTTAEEVPQTSRMVPRTLFFLIQVMYLSFYIGALANLPEIQVLISAAVRPHLWMMAAIVVTAAIGIPVRLYMMSAISFDYRGLPLKFRRLFPVLFALDELWAFSPFLVMHHIGFGWAVAATAGLLYLPFSQRTLLLMAYANDFSPRMNADNSPIQRKPR